MTEPVETVQAAELPVRAPDIEAAAERLAPELRRTRCSSVFD